MHFTIIRDVRDKNGHIPGMGLMSVDNETVMLNTSRFKPPNASIVTWAGNRGLIQYNDRPEVRKPVTDISPYQSWVDRFMTVVADADPPLNLEQAKQLKIDMVEALYDDNRKKPFIYLSNEYECTDEAIAYMGAALAVVTGDGSTGLANQINAGLINLVGQVNGVIGAINTGITNSVVFPNNNTTATTIANLVNNWATTSLMYGTLQATVTPYYYMYRPSGAMPVSAGTVGYMGWSNVPLVMDVTIAWSGASAAPISWQPLNSATMIDIPFVTFSAVVKAIVARRNELNLDRQRHKRAINLLTTVAAVIAYDVTDGWPFTRRGALAAIEQHDTARFVT